MKFIETKREELRRERIALNEQEWPELVQLLNGIGEGIEVLKWRSNSSTQYSLVFSGCLWIRTFIPDTITLSELKAKYFEEEQREPKVGDWGYFWSNETDTCAHFSKLSAISSHNRYVSLHGTLWTHFSHTIPPHIQELMKEPEYEVIHSFGESDGEIKEIAPGLYAGTRGGVAVVLKIKKA